MNARAGLRCVPRDIYTYLILLRDQQVFCLARAAHTACPVGPFCVEFCTPRQLLPYLFPTRMDAIFSRRAPAPCLICLPTLQFGQFGWMVPRSGWDFGCFPFPNGSGGAGGRRRGRKAGLADVRNLVGEPLRHHNLASRQQHSSSPHVATLPTALYLTCGMPCLCLPCMPANTALPPLCLICARPCLHLPCLALPLISLSPSSHSFTFSLFTHTFGHFLPLILGNLFPLLSVSLGFWEKEVK